MLATNGRIPAGRIGTEDDFAKYRDVVADIFAHHHRAEPAGADGAQCSCGDVWPCREEVLAAELLDWI